jgi:glycosyltransferase involved in cell wall biosynthesis
MVSFQAKFMHGLERRGIATSFDLADPANSAVLVIGGTRHLPGLLRARRRGIRIVQRLNGMNWLQRKQPTPLRARLRAEGNNLLLAIIRRWLADAIVYQSGFSRSWWERVYGPIPAQAGVVYNGVDLNAYSPLGPERPPAETFRILLVEGHLRSDNIQGLENAVRLVELLQKAGQSVRLQVAGDVPGPVRGQWNDRAGGIEWAGVLSRDQIPGLDRAAHLLFSADLNAACPNSVIEALACGLPVAAFDTGALRELVQDGAGEVVPYGSDYWNLAPPVVDPLAQAAAEILRQNERYRQAARRRAEQAFGLDRMVDGYIQALLG